MARKPEANVIRYGDEIDIVIKSGLDTRFTGKASIYQLYERLARLDDLGYKINFYYRSER